ncbi:AAA family ATPase [Actinomadura sp. K4S16]|uniref:AAA family ATPase n=1 Tax=Actinomadura sp. K4S16 TaxID=1316147 RepID=UPI0011EC4B8B|nr:LuxR family transcriptional regulator [Actinomadura sp. K4S16]
MGTPPMLYGRSVEQARIERLIAGARTGRGGAAVIRGAPGIGKTALLDHAADAADGTLALRCAGSPCEAGQPFAGLDLLLRPVRDGFDALPGAAADRLRALSEPCPDGEVDLVPVRLAFLALLRRIAGERPVLCLVDDAQWLDPASADVLAFAARRLAAEPVALLAADRGEETFRSSGLPDIRPDALEPHEAAALLRDGGGGLSPLAVERVVAEADGNPLALRLLAGCLTPGQRAGRINPFTFHDGTRPIRGPVLDEAAERLDALPARTRTLLLAAAADDARDAARLAAAASRLGASAADLAPAERAGLVEAAGTAVAFTHPLVRAASYQHATASERRAVHRALADRAGREDPEARAWHRAAAALGRGEDVAAELERAGEWSGDRRAYLCYARAAELTPDGGVRAHRLAAAARSASEAGLFGAAAELAARAAPLAADTLTRAELAQVGAAVEFECGSPGRAARTLVEGALPIVRRDPAEALLMLADAVRCGWHAGDPGLVREAADALRAVRPPGHSPAADLARAVAEAAGPAGGAGGLGGLLGSLADEPGRRLAAACLALADGAHEAASRFARDCRDAAGRLPYALQVLAHAQIDRGRHREAREAAEEGLRLAGGRHRSGHLSCLLGWLAAVEGDERRCADLVAAGTEHARAERITPTVSLGTWALALLDLGHGRHDEALARLEDVPESAPEAGPVATVVRQASDRVEAAVRCRRPERARRPLALLEDRAAKHPSPTALALLERCRGQLAPRDEAEHHFARAAELLGREGGNTYERARTELLYGEWLRRARRRAEAHRHLALAVELFTTVDARVWAERARAELGAAGVAGPAAGADRGPAGGGPGAGGLTHQELQVVRLAAAGATNREIAARLYLSPRTVGNHLYRAYPKLGVRTRAELRRLDFGAGSGRPGE